jgi:hypothetical protein
MLHIKRYSRFNKQFPAQSWHLCVDPLNRSCPVIGQPLFYTTDQSHRGNTSGFISRSELRVSSIPSISNSNFSFLHVAYSYFPSSYNGSRAIIETMVGVGGRSKACWQCRRRRVKCGRGTIFSYTTNDS